MLPLETQATFTQSSHKDLYTRKPQDYLCLEFSEEGQPIQKFLSLGALGNTPEAKTLLLDWFRCWMSLPDSIRLLPRGEFEEHPAFDNIAAEDLPRRFPMGETLCDVRSDGQESSPDKIVEHVTIIIDKRPEDG